MSGWQCEQTLIGLMDGVETKKENVNECERAPSENSKSRDCSQ